MTVRRKAALLASACTLAGSVLAVGPPGASAAPACAGLPAGSPVRVNQIPGWAESIIVDQHGRMFATGFTSGRVYRIDRPGATPVAITGYLGSLGGIVVRPDGKLLVGTPNIGPVPGVGEVLLVDPDTGATSVYASGLNSIDGLALAPDGTVYTSTFAGTQIGRVTPQGQVDPEWAHLASPNGIAVSPDERYVYAVQTAIAAKVYQIPVDDPAHPQVVVSTGLGDALATPDGMTLDDQGRILVATEVSGQIWRVEDGRVCTIQSGQVGTPQVTYGHGPDGFSAGHLYRSGIDGSIWEIPAGRTS